MSKELGIYSKVIEAVKRIDYAVENICNIEEKNSIKKIYFEALKKIK